MKSSTAASQEIPANHERHNKLLRLGRFRLSNLLIVYRLPLLMGVILSGVVIASTWAAYRGVKESALEVGRERLRNLTHQLATLTQQSTVALLTKTHAAANDGAIREFLRSPSDSSRTNALAKLQQFTTANDPNSVQVELWTTKPDPVLTIPEGAKPQSLKLEKEFTESAKEPYRVPGAIRIVNNDLVFPSVASVRDESGRLLGYLVRWRRISSSPQASTQLADLLGSDMSLYLGNSKGDVWTNLVKVVPPPPGGLQSTLELTRYQRDGNSVTALGRPINGTPWFIVVEFPDRVFLTPARTFLERMIVIGFVLLLLGLVGSFLLSRTITRPLQAFSASATAISGGDYSRLVEINQKDELGILAGTFNKMVEKVRESQRDLELKVQERTAQLEAANVGLEAFSRLTSQDLNLTREELAGMTQQLWQASKLATMGELAASIAHELNNPLATVTLHTEFLVDQVRSDDERNALGVILNESERMATLVNDLLQFSRRGHRQVSTVDVQDEVTKTVEFISYHLRNRQIKVVFDFVDELPRIQADRQQLRQLFLNLLTNASDAMASGGQVTIRGTVASLENTEAILIEFTDTGDGMSPEQAEKVWEPFFTTKPEGKGTGLGLPICRRLTEEHGGKITLRSEPGKGTTVSILLPTAPKIAEGGTDYLIDNDS